MSIKGNIRKLLINGFWILAGSGILVLLVAAMQAKQLKRCAGIEVELRGDASGLFLDEADVTAIITRKGKLRVKGMFLESFDLESLEARLKQTAWVEDAELYFDNTQILKVKVTERQPVARIFPVKGSSYYLDGQGHYLPLSGKKALRVPIFTGYPYAGPDASDSARHMTQRIIALGRYIAADPFWMAQVAQVDIVGGSQFELIPTLGDHIVELGDGEQPEVKFRRLSLFYRQVLQQTGIDAYERIRVQYTGQVIGVRYSDNRLRYDSTEALRTVQRMISEIHSTQLDRAREDSLDMPEARPFPVSPGGTGATPGKAKAINTKNNIPNSKNN